MSASSAVVVGVDGSDASEQALGWAAKQAALHRRPLQILHAFLWPATGAYLGPSPVGPPDGGLLRAAEELLNEAASQARAVAPQIEVTTELAVSAPAARLIEESRSASTVVVGNRGLGGFTGLLIGSVGVQVAAHASCPVVVVRSADQATEEPVHSASGQVVVGVDASVEGEEALGYAFAEASLRHTGLIAVHAWTEPAWLGPSDAFLALNDGDAGLAEAERLLAEAVAGWREKYPDVPVTRRVVPGAPANELVRLSRGAELLVVGARGRGGFRGLLLGSVSQAAIHHAACPVAVVRVARTGDGA